MIVFTSEKLSNVWSYSDESPCSLRSGHTLKCVTTTDVDVRRRRRRRGFKGETFLITTTTDLREGCDCGGPLVGRGRGRSVGWVQV